MDLTPEEVRVLGCLLEKSQTTPDHYPLSTNALVAACNQKSSRDPIVSYSAREVETISTDLREMGLVRIVRGAGMRTHKHKHVFDEALSVSSKELAILAVLMLRGPQSHGELRTRTDRYVSFADTHEVLEVLSSLAARPEQLVENIGRESGQAQDRWRHMLSSAEPVAHDQPVVVNEANATSATPPKDEGSLERRVGELEERLAKLETALKTELGIGE